MASLTPDERVGQLVMVNFVGDDVSATSDIATLVRDFKIGAVLVTASNGNIVNRDDTAAQLATLTNGLQQQAFDTSQRSDGTNRYFLPLMVATDNEGDLFPFTNVTHNYTQLPNNMTIGATWSKQHAQATGAIAGRELSAAGINLLLGPVVDTLDNPRSGGAGDIGIRSFGGNVSWVGELARAYVRGVHDGSGGRMLTVIKHFPGHGGSDRGTDNEVPTVNKSLDQLRALELAPFAEVDRLDDADKTGTTDAMMVSHIRYRNFVTASAAAFTRPISIDAAALNTLIGLPEFSKWRTTHMIMSDSLGVPAVRKWYAEQEGQPDFPNRTIVKDALMSGSDLLPLVEFYHDPDHRGWKDFQLPTIEDSVIYMRQQYASDPDFRRRADDAVRHVIAEKVRLYPQLAMTQVAVDPAAASAAAGGGADEMRSLAEDALTLIQPQSVADLRARLPRGPVTPDKVVIVECWDDCYPYRVMPKLTLQQELLALYGPNGKNRLRAEDVSTISFGELDAWLTAPANPANVATAAVVRDASWIVFALTEYNPAARPASGAAKRFLDAPPVDLRNKNLVAIAYNVPYHLDSTEISKLSAYFVVYNKTDAAIDAGFRALFGDATPKGHSPVNVPGIFYNVGDATQPAVDQQLQVSVFGQSPGGVRDAANVGLTAGPIVDHNGNLVPDGTVVRFRLDKTGGTVSNEIGMTTIDGIAGARVPLSGAGSYSASASVAGVTSKPLAITVAGSVAAATEAPAPPAAAAAPASDSGGRNVTLLALAIGVPSAVIAAAAAAIGFVLYRRRSRSTAAHAAMPALAPATGVLIDDEPAATPAATMLVDPLVRVDAETRRVYVKGVEAKPALSNEQFRLLSFLFPPDDHADGVSEEALDALVRRVRERLVQSGGERSYIVTLRGHGFRLDI